VKRGIGLLLALVLASLACNFPTAKPTPEANVPPTSGPTYIPTATITPTSTATGTPTNTFTPTASPTITNTPPPPPPIQARICKGCQPRFRQTPGTAGRIIRTLDDTVAVTIIGRTADGAWAQVVLDNGQQGWVATQFIDLAGTDLNAMPVKGTAVDATLTATYTIGQPLVVSGITAHSREIFLKGKQLGNRANVLSKVGDSITATPMFLNPFGSGQFDLGDYSNQLGPVVSFFAGSFARGSLAAGNGWGADRIIEPGYSNPGLCGSDTPLVCEYKHNKPSVALIMIGTNDAGGVEPTVYAANLRRIVQISIDMGVIPVLTTVPPKHLDAWNNGRIDQWNNIIRTTARQYDVPLLDYWYALQKLPNQGISADGVHPSEPPNQATGFFTAANLNFGYTVRNLSALMMLDALWHQVLY
jgi:GDSL-like lipase/acylhydrolase family protein/SH3 domain-containing protein